MITYPSFTATINGTVVDALEFHTQHSVEAGIGQASITFPVPLSAAVFEGASVLLKGRKTTGDPLDTLFVGRIRGPLERTLSEGEASVTARCDGSLWRFALPSLADFMWVGPITPRKLIKQALTFWGYTNHKVEQFVHSTTGVPILLGGIPWFDDGRIVLGEGTSPFTMCDRICRLFGYRIYDRPDGTVRVSRVNGKPPSADFTLTEGEDVLTCSRQTDLHPIETYVIAQGASGTDLAGQAVEIKAVPRRGIKSKFIPNPPKFVGGSVSDSLLVTQQLADAARIARERDVSGISWTVRSEAIGEPNRVAALAPRMSFAADVADVGLNGVRFWLTGISQDFGPGGYWATIEGWRPTGKVKKSRYPDDIDDPEDEWESDADVKPAPTDSDLIGVDDIDDELPETWDMDLDDEYDPLDDPDIDPLDPEFDPEFPTAGLELPPESGLPTDVCTPAVARTCQTIGVSEPSWEDAVTEAAPLIETVLLPFAVDSVTVRGDVLGELLDIGGTVQLWQNAAMAGSGAIPAGDAEAWETFEVVIAATLDAGEVEVRVLAEDEA